LAPISIIIQDLCEVLQANWYTDDKKHVDLRSHFAVIGRNGRSSKYEF